MTVRELQAERLTALPMRLETVDIGGFTFNIGNGAGAQQQVIYVPYNNQINNNQQCNICAANVALVGPLAVIQLTL